MLRLFQAGSTHEDVFLQRYDALVRSAMHLTASDRAQAEDLVHDAFVQFTLARPELDDIRNLDAYLFGMLRNLHASNVRRAASRRATLSITDYDSADLCLRSLGPGPAAEARSDLRRVCEYACVRKQSSKAGSVLILRFFHGFFPAEIALILRSNRRLADEWLRISRREARVWLDSPERLAFIGAPAASAPPPLPAATDARLKPVEFVGELRRAIFRARHGECPTKRQLGDAYDPATDESISAGFLAHIVSCPACFDAVLGLLGLGSLKDRFPMDSAGPSTPSDSSPPGAGGGASGWLNRNLRRVREVREHRPKELRVIVNGLAISSLTTGQARVRQTITVNIGEPLAFIEVFSEQDVRLMLFPVQPWPEGSVEQTATVQLSDGRSLSATVRFAGPWPDFTLEYLDPTSESLLAGSPSVSDEARGAVADVPVSPDAEGGALPARRWWVPRFRWFRPVPALALATLAILVCFGVVWRQTEPASAAELIRDAQTAEKAGVPVPGQIAHRVLKLEQRRLPSRDLVRSRRIEVWRRGTMPAAARRVYDDQNRLVAGEWTAAAGARTIYQPESSVRVVTSDAPSLPATADEIWRLEPSAEAFASLFGVDSTIKLDEDALAYRLTSTPGTGRPPAAGAPALLEATLTLRKKDLRPIGQTFVTRDAAGSIESQLTEVGFNLVSADRVERSVFDVDANLLGASPTPEPLPVPALKPEPGAVPSSPARPELEHLSRLELDVLTMLHRVDACLAGRITVDRTSVGGLRIAGGAPHDDRARAMAALLPLSGLTNISLDIETRADSPTPPMTPAGAAGDRIRSHLLREISVGPYAQEPGGAPDAIERHLEEAVRDLMVRLSDSSLRGVRQARALEDVVQRWNAAADYADLDALAGWQSLIRDHALGVRKEVERLRVQLQPLFFAGRRFDSGPRAPGVSAGRGRDELARLAERLVELAHLQRTLLESVLASSELRERDLDSLWELFLETEKIAAAFRDPWVLREPEP